MDSLSYKTKFANSETVEKQWFVVDANGATLGRMTSEVAKILRGKNKTSFTPNVDCGDNVIVINADKVHLSGKKMSDKVYLSHTGYTGGQRSTTPKLLQQKSEKISKEVNGSRLEINGIVERAVRGMLPKNKLSSKVLKNLHVYIGENHPHEAQKPTTIKL